MFEGWLYQLLSGYLGNYVKDIQREKLRIGLWSGYVLLENVEVRAEAFDYLQLPFAIKQGFVGKLKLQVPWKKLGWEPVLITLEDVYICAGPRDDTEWDPEALDKRDLAVKRAKLAGAELEKWSQHVSDEKLQRSFFTHISARIIDNIQVAIGNVHIRFINESPDYKAKFSFGLTLAELTINNTDGPNFPTSGGAVAGKLRDKLVHKVVKIQNLAVYWNSQTHGSSASRRVNEDRSEAPSRKVNEDRREAPSSFFFDEEDSMQYLLHPVNADLKLTVNRNKIGEAGIPEYSIFVNVDDLKLRLDDHQYQELILLKDFLGASKSREKYGRYRPRNTERRGRGWSKLWWQYGIDAVLSDVREKRHRNSRMFFNWCREQRKSYVPLYKEKLECLQQGHPIGEAVVQQLEETEKKLDIDIILYYRALAERVLQSENVYIFEKKGASVVSFEANGSSSTDDQVKESVPHIERGWVSWLSLGMLGESGTLDTSQLSDSMSEAIIKDLYKATDFDPSCANDWQDLPKGYSWLALSLHLEQVAGTLHSMSSKMDITYCLLEGVVMSLRVWKESASIIVSLKNMEASDPSSQSTPYPCLLSSKRTSSPERVESSTVRGLTHTGSGSNFSSISSSLQDGKSNPVLRVDIEIYFLHKDLDTMITVNLCSIDVMYDSNTLILITQFFGPPERPQDTRNVKALESHIHSQPVLVFPSLRRVALQLRVEQSTIAFLGTSYRSRGPLMVITSQSFCISSSNHKRLVNDLASGSDNVAYRSSSFDAFQEESPPVGEDTQSLNINQKIHSKTASMNKFQLVVNGVKVILSSHSQNWQETFHSSDPALSFIDTFDMKATVYAYCTKCCPVSLKLRMDGSVPFLRVAFSMGKYKILDSLVRDLKSVHKKITSQPSVVGQHEDRVSDALSLLGSEHCNTEYHRQRNATSDVKLEAMQTLDSDKTPSTAGTSICFTLKTVIIEFKIDPEIHEITSNAASMTWVARLEDLQLKYIEDPWQKEVHLLTNYLLVQNDLNNSGISSLLNSILEISGTQVKLDVFLKDQYAPSNTGMDHFVPPNYIKAGNFQSSYCSKVSAILTAYCFAETVQCSIKNINKSNFLVEGCNAKVNSFCIMYLLDEGSNEIWTANFLALSLFHVESAACTGQSGKAEDLVDIQLLQSEDRIKNSNKKVSKLLSFIQHHDNDKERQACFELLNNVGAEKDMKVNLPLITISILIRQWNEVASAIESVISRFPTGSSKAKILPSIGKDQSLIPRHCCTRRQSMWGSSDPQLSTPVTERCDGKYSREFDFLNTSAKPSAMQVKINIPDLHFVLKDFASNGHPADEEEINNSDHDSASQNCMVIIVSAFVDKILSTGDKILLEARIPKLEASFEFQFQKEHLKICFLKVSSSTIKGEFSGRSEIKDLSLLLHANLVEVWCSNKILQFCRSFNFEPLGTGPSPLMDVELTLDACIESGSLLVTDARWSRSAPILEIIMENTALLSSWRLEDMEASLATNFRINYHNTNKVAWEPLLEICYTRCSISRHYKADIKYAARPYTKIEVSSSSALNINITEEMVQAVLLGIEMIEDSWNGNSSYESSINMEVGRRKDSSFASHWFQNGTGVAVKYWLVENSQGKEQYQNSLEASHDGNKFSDYQYPVVVDPGCTVPICIEENKKPILQSRKSTWKSAEVTELQAFEMISHRQIRFQLEGASRPSPPMSIDLVGCRAFEVVFSNTLSSIENPGHSSETNQEVLYEDEEKYLEKTALFSAHVVLEVTIQGYSKLIKLHSKVCLVNATSNSLEVRFDIPFGVSPKVLDQVMPGQTAFLPVHLAETGKIRWRPYGDSHLWSETQSLTNIILSTSHHRPSVCYPVHPSSNGPFRCCLNVSQVHLATKADTSGSLYSEISDISEGERNVENKTESSQASYSPSARFKDQSEGCGVISITLYAPLVIRNLLTCALEMSIESKAASNLSLSVPTDGSMHIHDVDVSHNLCINISASGYLPCSLKFDRAIWLTEEAHSKSHHKTMSITCDCVTLQPKSVSGSPLRVNLEKVVDMTNGARKLDIYVPYWLYNCTDLDMIITDDVPFGKEIFLFGTVGYGSFETEQQHASYGRGSYSKAVGLQSILELHDSGTQPHKKCLSERIPSSKIASHLPSYIVHPKKVYDDDPSEKQRMFIHDPSRNPASHERIAMQDGQMYFNGPLRNGEIVPCMYSPEKGSEINEHRLRARLVLSGHVSPDFRDPKETIWSRPFSLDFPTGIATIMIPNLTKTGACVVSVGLAPIIKTQTGKTKMVTFQPRYVLANACKKGIYFKQQGTERFQLLPVGNYSHLHWDDVSRNLLVSARYDEHGWDWSGGFAPNVLGDTQVKMYNYVTGAREMIRVEVTIANTHLTDEVCDVPASVSHGTYLIVITNDETGFMPYRIENFSMEKLRFYQQKCDKMETILYAYSSCDYAWDEPCQPHRLIIEIPGQGSLGAYGLENIKDFPAVTFPAKAEVPERRFLVSVRAEGPKRVLSVTDASIHVEKDLSLVNYVCKADRSSQTPKIFAEEYSINLACIGFSLIDPSPQEVAYASAKGILLHVQQDQDQQKVTFQVESFQVDNQLRHAAYPVLLSTLGSLEPGTAGSGNDKRLLNDQRFSDLGQSVNVAFKVAINKWQHAASSIDCYQYIYARISPLMLELEDRSIISLYAFMKTLSLSLSMRNKTMSMLRQRSGVGNLDSEVAEKYNKNSLLSFKTVHLNWSRWRTRIAEDYLAVMIQNQVAITKEKKKVYIEVLHIEHIELTVSFSSAPWITKQHQTSAQRSLLWTTGTLRRFIALVDVEDAPVYLGRLILTHPMANWNAINEIISRHYTRQLLHEFYKVLGSADVLGNPMGFLRSLRLGIWDFFSSPTRSVLQNPKELMKGISKGTKSLLNNTIFAFSNAASQMSKAAQKGVAAFVLDQDYIAELGRRQQEQGLESSILNEFLEGLTGLLQLSVRGAEKHGLPGIFSGAAVGAVGAIARPAASMLELSKKTFQSIRNRTMAFRRHRVRVRLPRHLHGSSLLRPFSWDEAVGMAVLLEAEGGRFGNEVFVTCKKLSESTKFVVLTKKILLRVKNTTLAAVNGESVSSFGPEWHIELEEFVEDALHVDVEGSTTSVIFGLQNSTLKRVKQRVVFNQKVAAPSPFRTESFEFPNTELAGEFLISIKNQMDQQKGSLSNRVVSSRTL